MPIKAFADLSLWEPFGGLCGLYWTLLGAILKAVEAFMGVSRGLLGALLGPSRGSLGALLGALGALLGRSWRPSIKRRGGI